VCLPPLRTLANCRRRLTWLAGPAGKRMHEKAVHLAAGCSWAHMHDSCRPGIATVTRGHVMLRDGNRVVFRTRATIWARRYNRQIFH
jgi:hypothetical protein